MAVQDSIAAPGSISKKRRGIRKPLSCVECRRRKLRCDRQQPCLSCVKRDVIDSCTYEDSAPRPARIDNYHDVQAHIERIEALLKAYRVDKNAVLLTEKDQLPGSGSTGNDSDGSTSQSGNGSSEVTAAYTSPDDTKMPELKTMLETHRPDLSPKVSIPSFQWNALQDQVSLLRDAFNTEKPIGNAATSALQPSIWEFAGSAESAVSDAAQLLPPIEICDYLIGEYFSKFFTILPVMYGPHFKQIYNRVRSDILENTVPDVSPTVMALLCAVIASTISYIGPTGVMLARLQLKLDYYPGQPLEDLAHRLRTMSFQCLTADNFINNYSATTVQTLIIIVDCLTHSYGDEGPCWPLSGLILNMAIALGCNDDLDDVGLDPIEREVRHRCWGCMLTLDLLQSCLFGRPTLSFMAHHTDGSLPLNVNDANIMTGNFNPMPTSCLTDMSFILSKLRIGFLFLPVYRKLRQKKSLVYDDVLNICQKLYKANSWDEPYITEMSTADGGTLYRYYILQTVVNQHELLLHRPFFETHAESRRKCITAATDIVRRTQHFFNGVVYEPNSIYIRGLGIFYCFHASVVLATVAAQQLVEQNGDASELLQDFEKGIDAITRVAPISPLAARSAPVVLRLKQALQLLQSNRQLSIAGGNEIPLKTETMTKPTDDIMDVLNSSLLQDWTQFSGPNFINWNEWDQFDPLS